MSVYSDCPGGCGAVIEQEDDGTVWGCRCNDDGEQFPVPTAPCRRCGCEPEYFLHTTTPATCNPDDPDGCGAEGDHHEYAPRHPDVVFPDLRLAVTLNLLGQINIDPYGHDLWMRPVQHVLSAAHDVWKQAIQREKEGLA